MFFFLPWRAQLRLAMRKRAVLVATRTALPVPTDASLPVEAFRLVVPLLVAPEARDRVARGGRAGHVAPDGVAADGDSNVKRRQCVVRWRFYHLSCLDQHT